jgi:hypothetical protein
MDNMNDKSFDRQFAAMEKTVKRGFKATAILGALWALGVGAFVVTVLYVVWHFISKFW